MKSMMILEKLVYGRIFVWCTRVRDGWDYGEFSYGGLRVFGGTLVFADFLRPAAWQHLNGLTCNLCFT